MRSILEDTQGSFWFGTWKEGVARFDGESLTYFTEQDGLRDNQVRTILEGRDGTIWFESGLGISSFDGERIVTHTERDYTSKDEWQVEAGDLWFKGDESYGVNELEGQAGVYRYDGESFIYLRFPLPKTPDAGAAYAVTCNPVQGAGGILWFGTYAAAIGYDGESFTIIDRHTLGLDKDDPHLGVRCLFVDREGKLWIGDNGIGAFVYDGEMAINFTANHGLTRQETMGKSPSLHSVFALGGDRDGNIWFGTHGSGAWRYDGESLRNFGPEDGLESESISAIYRDKRGDLWFGGDLPSGVYKLNGESFERIH